ncbi:short-chain dehydrogenase [Amnibacterium flavum]|uniref:Short-chain dehydrogenase n=2 Tax=Amnibacterium flavum TaxID=2173173 RepID=A0A2V1HN70_9MICO|nr:short-chain dehydrogenase [Amnibacterium flavum]
MVGRTVVLTGASSGIGGAAARALSALGAEIAIVGRNPERTAKTAKELGADAFVADYGRLAEVRSLASDLLARYPRIHVLANNAGGMQNTRTFTADRNERTFQESHLAGFLLTDLILPRIVETAKTAPKGSVRIIQTASVAARGGRISLDDLDSQRGPWLGGWRAYSNVKLANILFIKELARRIAGTGVEAYSFHPGFVRTSFGAGGWMMSAIDFLTHGNYGISPEQGAEPLIRLIAAAEIDSPSGTYFDRLLPDGSTSAQADDAVFAKKLWRASQERVDTARS